MCCPGAFDSEIQQAETFFEERLNDDWHLKRRKKVMQDLDAKIGSVSSSGHNARASVDKAYSHTSSSYHVWGSAKAAFDADASHRWRDWDMVSLKPDIAKTAAFLLNPCSSKFPKSKQSTFRQCDMSSNTVKTPIKERVRDQIFCS